MMSRRLLHVVVALATLGTPLAAFAQTVTTEPLQAAPAMGIPLLALLAVVLAGLAMYFLRRGAGRAIAVGTFVAVLTTLAGVAYTTPPMVEVEGPECRTQTTQIFTTAFPNTLVSHCPNPIRIVSIDIGMCDPGDTYGPAAGVVDPCSLGQVLANGDECSLPTCDR